jgi:hypothetical protein
MQSVHLSEELTNMIHSAQEAHLKLVEQYINERREKADLFLKEKWIPDFIGNFVSAATVLQDIDQAGTKAEKGIIMINFSEAASKEIFKRRTAINDALNNIERTLKKKITAHYEEMLMVNQALTAHLRSAAKVTAIREELLKQLRIEPEELIPVDKINESLEKIIRFEGKVEDLPSITNEIVNQINGE